MRNIYDIVMNHRSIRKYKEEDIPDKYLKMILDGAIHSPSSVNGQQCSVVVIRDSKKKAKLAEYCGDQEWIKQAPVFLVLVADFSRVAKGIAKKNGTFDNMDSIEASLVGAVDCGIAFGTMMNLAESLGYGIVPIGAVRDEPQKVIDLLKLPKYVYPILGMCIGVPDEDPGLKPRFHFTTLIHEEEYREITDQELDDYDDLMKGYMADKIVGEEVKDWSDMMKRVYSGIYYPRVKETMKKQGFKNEK